MKVALVHYWLVGMRGGEKVLDALCRFFPEADIFTHVYEPAAVSEEIRRHTVKTTAISRLPFAKRLYQSYLPFMPTALEGLDLSAYDLVISSEAGPAKGVIVPPCAVHVCYCHSPMRYLWDQYHIYKQRAGLPVRVVMPHIARNLRQWDVVSATRVDAFVANSHHVAARIRKYWRRDALVVHPPVAIDDFAPIRGQPMSDYYLWVGELAPYKRPDIAVEAFSRLGKKLVVIGGPAKEQRLLARKAGETIIFLGKVPFETLRDYMARCRALIFPGEEDFGIVPVEAMASGRPVIAFGRGGVLDTVVDRETGLLFHNQSVEGLMSAVEEFEVQGLDSVDPAALVANARRFSEQRFFEAFARLLSDLGIHLTENTR